MDSKIPHYCLDLKGNILFESDSSRSETAETAIDLKTLTYRDSKKKIALIDRDGVIVEKAPRFQYLQGAKDLRIIQGTAEAIRYLNKKGVLVVLVTNQPGIYKGQLTKDDLYDMTSTIQESLGKGKIDAVFFCPHAAPTEGDHITKEEECLCRKPKPGMLTAAMQLYTIKPENAIMFGDFASDLGAAHNAGITAAFIATKHDESEAMRQKIQKEYPEVFAKRNYAHLLEAVMDLF